MSTIAILPVKRFELAKQRLGEELPPGARRRLAQAMVGDVLVALRDSAGVDRTLVVTNERTVAAAAAYQGSIVIADQTEQGQSAAALQGIARARAEGAARIVLVPGDCPALDPGQLDEVLRAHTAERQVVVIPDRHGTGTNGLLLAPPGAIEPGFGPGSFERHCARAREAGVPCAVARPSSLLLDVDTGDDLRALRDALAAADASGRATRTRSVLAELLGSAAPAA